MDFDAGSGLEGGDWNFHPAVRVRMNIHHLGCTGSVDQGFEAFHSCQISMDDVKKWREEVFRPWLLPLILKHLNVMSSDVLAKQRGFAWIVLTCLSFVLIQHKVKAKLSNHRCPTTTFLPREEVLGIVCVRSVRWEIDRCIDGNDVMSVTRAPEIFHTWTWSPQTAPRTSRSRTGVAVAWQVELEAGKSSGEWQVELEGVSGKSRGELERLVASAEKKGESSSRVAIRVAIQVESSSRMASRVV